MENLYLLRHGETELNVKKVYYGSTDCALTAQGEADADKLRAVFAEIPVQLCFVSPLKRAVDTAMRIFPQRQESFLCRDENLRELDFGAWEGKHYSELEADPHWQKWAADYFHVAPPGGESFLALSHRVCVLKETLFAREEQHIAIVGHHGVLTLLMALLLEMPPEKCWHFTFHHGAYTHFSFADAYPVLRGHNLKS